jgi:hypothetical protein
MQKLARRLGATPKDSTGKASSQMLDAKGFTVKHLEVQSLEHALMLVRRVSQKVSMLFGWPSWVATGDIDDVSQHGLTHSTRISQHNIRKRRQVLKMIASIQLATHVANVKNFSDENKAQFLQDYTIIAHFPNISFETLAQQVNSICKMTANRLISRRHGQRLAGFNCDLMQFEVDKEAGELGTSVNNQDAVGDDSDLDFQDNFDIEGQTDDSTPRDQVNNPSPTGAETSSGSPRSVPASA